MPSIAGSCCYRVERMASTAVVARTLVAAAAFSKATGSFFRMDSSKQGEVQQKHASMYAVCATVDMHVC